MSPSQSGALYSQKNEMNVCPRIPISLLASHHEGMSHQNLNCLRAGMILQVLAASRQDKRHVCMHAGRQTHVLIPVAGRVGWTSGSPMWVAENTLTAAYLIADIPHSLAQQRPQHWLHAATVKQYKL